MIYPFLRILEKKKLLVIFTIFYRKSETIFNISNVEVTKQMLQCFTQTEIYSVCQQLKGNCKKICSSQNHQFLILDGNR